MKWNVWGCGKCEPTQNMAADEALLEFAKEIDAPVLRFYGWKTSAATFGYSQKYAELEKLTLLRPLIRRPTGGGLVSHDRDWTYSLCVPPHHVWYSLKAKESYRKIHEWLRDAFLLSKIQTELNPTAVKDIPGQCFMGAEEMDLLWQGKKIAGAAQRRNRKGLLIQGSVQLPIECERKHWHVNMLAAGTILFGTEPQVFIPSSGFEERVAELGRKYASEEYNQQR